MANQKVTKPNHFIAIPITDLEIIANIGSMQKAVTEQGLDPEWNGYKDTSVFKECMVPLTKLHINLKVMNLVSDADIERAKQVLEEVGRHVRAKMAHNPITLEIEGLGNFGTKVIFAKLNDSSVARLAEIHQLFQAKFNEHLGVPIDIKPFAPRLTVSKIELAKTRNVKKLPSFPPNMWTDFNQTNFGSERVTSLQLLKMGEGDPVTGRYLCRGQVELS